jgi:S-methylmethionine-dependent homocysteine/selenocysteine methylase
VAAGARFVGGCCGTGPADIALLAARLHGPST